MTSMIGMSPGSVASSRGMSATGANVANSASATGKTSVEKLGGYRHFQRPSFTPEQMQLFQSMFGQLGPESFLGKLAGGDQSAFEQMEAPALRQFQGLQGQIASRFSGQGLGGRRSSGFQNTMNQASSDFAQQLQGNRLNLQRQALGDLMGFSNQLLGQRPYEQYATPKSRSFLQESTLALIGAGGEAARGYLQAAGGG